MGSTQRTLLHFAWWTSSSASIGLPLATAITTLLAFTSAPPTLTHGRFWLGVRGK